LIFHDIWEAFAILEQSYHHSHFDVRAQKKKKKQKRKEGYD